MLLLYDGKCTLCRNLANKIHFVTEEKVGIQPLTSPEAREILARHYPKGWKHDFYVIQGNRCRKGLKALPGLLRRLGYRHSTSILADFFRLRLNMAKRKSCGPNGDALASKRGFLKAAALTPVAFALSKLKASTPEPFEKELPPGFLVHIAEVSRDGAGGFYTRTYRATDALKAAAPDKPLPSGLKTKVTENTELLVEKFPNFAANTGIYKDRLEESILKFVRIRYEGTLEKAEAIEKRQMVLHSGLYEHAEYNIAVNYAESRRASMAGMVRHYLPYPVLDYVVFRDSVEDAAAHFQAQLEGIGALARLHERAGRTDLARVYDEMLQGFSLMADRFDAAVGETLAPETNQLLITSMPEALKFVQLPQHLKGEGGYSACDCSCGCDTCCGCGCGVEISVCAGASIGPCGCGCCASCGCGCSCCVELL